MNNQVIHNKVFSAALIGRKGEIYYPYLSNGEPDISSGFTSAELNQLDPRLGDVVNDLFAKTNAQGLTKIRRNSLYYALEYFTHPPVIRLPVKRTNKHDSIIAVGALREITQVNDSDLYLFNVSYYREEQIENSPVSYANDIDYGTEIVEGAALDKLCPGWYQRYLTATLLGISGLELNEAVFSAPEVHIKVNMEGVTFD